VCLAVSIHLRRRWLLCSSGLGFDAVGMMALVVLSSIMKAASRSHTLLAAW
jgi:hypothetical protein